MKKFEGILIATDLDRTLFWNGISENNRNAIKYFIDNGGYFTIASGRTYDYLKDMSKLVDTNTYNICLNGAYIANVKSGEVLYSNTCKEDIFPIIYKVLTEGDEFEKVSLIIASDKDRYSEIEYYTSKEFSSKYEELSQKKIAKVLLVAKDSAVADSAIKRIKKMELGIYVMERSWDIGFEFLHRENIKGVAIKRLATAIGAKKIIAVGDYENDISMIKAADIGYAVENATGSLKQVADRITVHCKESAIAKIIEDIEKEISE